MPLRSASAKPSVRLVEIGWEVCNQLGGIYTVLRSKAPEMVEEWGDRYALLGPLNRNQAAIEFEDEEIGDQYDRAPLSTRGRSERETAHPCARALV